MTYIIILVLLVGGWFLIKKNKTITEKQNKEEAEDKIHPEDAIKTVIGKNINFTSFDFETATRNPASACALAVTVVQNGKITEEKNWLINPKIKRFNSKFIDIHGITPEMVENEKTFKELYPEIIPYFKNQTLVAHNFHFDKEVFEKLLDKYKLDYIKLNGIDTIDFAKHFYPEFSSFSLDSLCRNFGIELNHHEAQSDSLACAKLALLFCSLTDFNTIEELQTTVSSKKRYDEIKKTYAKSNYIINQDVIIGFTSKNCKTKTYNEAIELIKTCEQFRETKEDSETIYSALVNTLDEAKLRYFMTLTSNWKTQLLQIEGKKVKHKELSSALWFSKLSREEIESSEYTSKESELEKGENMKFLLELFESKRRVK